MPIVSPNFCFCKKLEFKSHVNRNVLRIHVECILLVNMVSRSMSVYEKMG